MSFVLLVLVCRSTLQAEVTTKYQGLMPLQTFASGIVWAPPKRWAEEVIEEFASFPVGDHE